MANEHSGHRDRLRERYLSEGLDGFPPHNVLELLLFYVLNAAPEQLAQVEGIGMNAAVHLHLVADIARRYYAEAITPLPNDAQREDLMRYYGKKLVAACNGLPEETLYLVCLDNNLREISTDRISTGAPNAVQLPGRKIAEVALRHHAPSIDHFIIAGSDYVSMAQSGFFSSAARQTFAFRSPEDDLDPGFPAD